MAFEGMSQGHGGPFAALVVRQGEILGRGINKVTSLRDPTAHAEVVAIREACRRLDDFQLKGCDIYATSEPCPMCWGAIFWARMSRVHFASTTRDAAAAGFDDKLFYDELGKPCGQRMVPAFHVPLDSAKRLFEAWRQKPDRMDY